MQDIGGFDPERLRAARRGCSLTQAALARAVHKHTGTIRAYETSQRLPPAPVEAALCDALGLAPDGLRAAPDKEVHRKPKRAPRVDAPGDEAARIRTLIAEWRKDPEYVREIENAPPLSDHAKVVIRNAFAIADERAEAARRCTV